jgi:hypothetical protein
MPRMRAASARSNVARVRDGDTQACSYRFCLLLTRVGAAVNAGVSPVSIAVDPSGNFAYVGQLRFKRSLRLEPCFDVQDR